MKKIEVEDDLYQYIASQTQHIGESASDILRRLLFEKSQPALPVTLSPKANPASHKNPIGSDELQSAPELAVLIAPDELQKQKGVVGRFLYILQCLHEGNPNRFHQVLAIRGPSRIYFAMSKQELLAAGSSTNPKQIPNSAFWVITNNNTDKKREMLTLVCNKLGYDEELTERISSLLGASMKRNSTKEK